jgi:hypothetical protein
MDIRYSLAGMIKVLFIEEMNQPGYNILPQEGIFAEARSGMTTSSGFVLIVPDVGVSIQPPYSSEPNLSFQSSVISFLI